MTTASLKKFLVLYLAPAHVLEAWAKTDPATRKAAEATMRSDWDRWMREYGSLLTVTEAGGPTKAVTASGVADVRNDIMLYSVVQAVSHEAAAQAFAHHPHLGIPESSIQVMEVRAMGAPA